MKHILMFITTACLLGVAEATFIAPDFANVIEGGTWSAYFGIDYTIDGVSLTVWDETGVLTADAMNNGFRTQWSSYHTTSALIEYQFDTSIDQISSFYLWNAHHATETYFNNSGVRDFDLLFYSGTTLLGTESYTATMNTGSGPIGAQSFSGFEYSDVTSVNVDVKNNYGDIYSIMIHEVGFETIPEPSTVSLLGLGALASVFARRQKIKRNSAIQPNIKLNAFSEKFSDHW